MYDIFTPRRRLEIHLNIWVTCRTWLDKYIRRNRVCRISINCHFLYDVVLCRNNEFTAISQRGCTCNLARDIRIIHLKLTDFENASIAEVYRLVFFVGGFIKFSANIRYVACKRERPLFCRQRYVYCCSTLLVSYITITE